MSKLDKPNLHDPKIKYIYKTGEPIMLGDEVEINGINYIISCRKNRKGDKAKVIVKSLDGEVSKKCNIYHLRFIRRSAITRLRGKITEKKLSKAILIDPPKLKEINIKYQDDEKFVKAVLKEIKNNNKQKSECWLLTLIKTSYYQATKSI